MRRHREDPVGSAFELTSVMHSILPNSFWGRRPATHLAAEWLLGDLKNLGWGEGGSSWNELK